MGWNEDDDLAQQSQKRLGRLPMRTTRKALNFSDFFRFVQLPKRQEYWIKKAALPARSFGNLEAGCCTRASQANAILRMERQEQRRLIEITDAEVLARYREMSDRRYGGGDNGAFEIDALDDWRNPETTIRDALGNPHTIDAYLRINALNHDELRAALALAGVKGIKVCFNLPKALAGVDPPSDWYVPTDGRPLIGDWLAGSWGGHSGFAMGYNTLGLYLDHTWDVPYNLMTWECAAAYLDEAHLCLDSIDAWRKKASAPKVRKALGDVADAVNAASALQVKLA